MKNNTRGEVRKVEDRWFRRIDAAVDKLIITQWLGHVVKLTDENQ